MKRRTATWIINQSNLRIQRANMSRNQYFFLGENVTLLNCKSVQLLRTSHPQNKKLLEIKDIIFEIRQEIEDHCEDYDVLYMKFCKANNMFNEIKKLK